MSTLENSKLQYWDIDLLIDNYLGGSLLQCNNWIYNNYLYEDIFLDCFYYEKALQWNEWTLAKFSLILYQWLVFKVDGVNSVWVYNYYVPSLSHVC